MKPKKYIFFCLIISLAMLGVVPVSWGNQQWNGSSSVDYGQYAATDSPNYNGEWSGTTDQDSVVYFIVTENINVSSFGTDFYVVGASCSRHLNFSGYTTAIAGNGLTISADIPSIGQFSMTGTITTSGGKYVCNGTWYAKSYECDAEASGTWSAEGPTAEPDPGPGPGPEPEPQPEQLTSQRLATGDFNGDGKDDLVGLTQAGQIYYTTDLLNWQYYPWDIGTGGSRQPDGESCCRCRRPDKCGADFLHSGLCELAVDSRRLEPDNCRRHQWRRNSRFGRTHLFRTDLLYFGSG